MIIGGERTPGGLMGRSPGKSEVSLTGVQSPPIHGGGSPARMALRGKAEEDAEGGFLGGARSPRPYGTAVRMPTHCVAIGGFTISR
jgi:hypothetical protein